MSDYSGMVHLRRSTEADARAIATVHVKSWQGAYPGLISQDVLDALSVDARERFWSRELGVMAPDRRPWIADVDGEAVGFVSVGGSEDNGATGRTGQVYAIYLLPECWDRGIGRNLLAHGERDLRQRGYDEATLWVLSTNDRARRFYEAAGWTADGVEKTENFGGADLHEVRYRKRLRPL